TGGRSMILTEPRVSQEAFTRRTGWTFKPEGACKGDACVPMPAPAGEWLDAGPLSQRLNMPLLHDEQAGLWCLGPAWLWRAVAWRGSAVGRSAGSRVARLAGRHVRASISARTQGPAPGLGLLVRLPVRPARVAGPARGARLEGTRSGHGGPRPQGCRDGRSLD